MLDVAGRGANVALKGNRLHVSVPALAVVLLSVAAASSACAPQQATAVHRIAKHHAITPLPQRVTMPSGEVAESSSYVAEDLRAGPSYVAWGSHTVDSRLAEIGDGARRRWRPYFDRAGVAYPPASVTLVAFKRERRVEIYGGSPYAPAYLRTMAIDAASGGPGPKLREGDRQVPEGVYEVTSLNPNSAYHVALRLSYPNDFDQLMGAHDHRSRLGSDIMIHGSDRSIGCIAVGDIPAEDLFVLSADVGLDNISVLIAPRDFRRTGETEPLPGQPSWVRELYSDLDRRLRLLPAPVASANAGESLAARP